MYDYDAIIVGSGHNGLTTAGYLAREGLRVLVLERRDIVGGAVCTEEVIPGYKIDVGSSAHIMIHLTPVVKDLELEKYGLEYIDMDPYAFYPLPDGGRLQLSREDYVAPKGRRIEGTGVEPDLTVTRTLADLRAGRDPELEAAVRVLKERK
jgi:phytoene dehydrogenase-like protein